MNVTCSACPAKYVIPDEKVRGRKVRIPCKHCGAAIIIDGTALVAEAVAPKAQSLPASPLIPSLSTSERAVRWACSSAGSNPATSTTRIRPQRRKRLGLSEQSVRQSLV